ncbi:hypothetical protein F6R98_20525 [Candidatus Methylospira mobilis]|uniref:Uncharacterized protein n=1 Tax=Candidatus Methylospira mobilis TaxID=1808979 RepID=A0A5Q0BLS3_9GAMM|nr:hypothetical protein [Candidatus Methylospira mobilis]QFY44720.1 hypothetical protein F6R98_20525 [Candidatus Methylospira mobilis]WNV05739.1 hypothetical protein RP726_04785 [Candidatus Methylospira mobilis]
MPLSVKYGARYHLNIAGVALEDSTQIDGKSQAVMAVRGTRRLKNDIGEDRLIKPGTPCYAIDHSTVSASSDRGECPLVGTYAGMVRRLNPQDE